MPKIINRYTFPSTKFLTNFYPCTIVYEGQIYPSVEHAYQAAKCNNPSDAAAIRCCLSPRKALELGRKVERKDNWKNIKVSVMKELLRNKFVSPALARQLIETKNATIMDDKPWGDTFWGSVNGEGKNVLGLLIMEVRDELKAEKLKAAANSVQTKNL